MHYHVQQNCHNTMAKSWHLLLLASLLQPIVCSREDILAFRRSRSSHVDTSEFISDNLMGSKSIENLPRKPQKQPQHGQQPLQHYETDRRMPAGNLNDTIRSIFHVGPDDGLTLFNTTLNSHISQTDQMQADDSFSDNSSNAQQAFKRPTEAQPLAKPFNRDFVFPDQLFIGTEPKCEERLYEGKPFCTKVTNYPALSQLETILTSEFSKFGVFFSEDLAQPQNITQRMNNEPDEEYLCASVEKIIYPEAAMTKDSNWLLIVNNHGNYKQGVRIEECLNEGEMCHVVQFPNHYTATCKQNFIYRSLVAITPNGTITKDHFKMPSCCKCVLKQVH